jgi:hypothetical protein
LERSSRVVATHELIHSIDERVQAAIGVRPRFRALAEEFVSAGPELAEAGIGFFAMSSERHRYINHPANSLPLGLNKPLRFRLPLFEQLNVHRELGLLLNDEAHP